jgi:hypothetical protein
VRVLRLLPVLLLAALGGAPVAQAHHGGGSGAAIKVVASGLVSPRHLAFGSHGDLFVAEAGAGGSDLHFLGGEGPANMGASGAVTEVDRWGRQFRIIDKLPSMANDPGNGNGIGPHGITVIGRDEVFITNGGPTEPRVLPAGPGEPPGPDISREELAESTPQADLFGRVLWIRQHRAFKVADIWDFERRVNPDAAVANPAVDSNPVDLLFDGGRIVVADAGGNALDVVRPFGRVSNLAVFPGGQGHTPAYQAVPTSVVQGPDGFYYMSQLTGFPFIPGAANIFRVDPRTGAYTVFKGGFTNLMDLAFGRDGTLYALSIAKNGLLNGTEGAIYAISRRGDVRELALPAGTLNEPGGITVGNDGLYVTNNGGSPTDGQVLRVSGRF